jgi:hypothetical protein
MSTYTINKSDGTTLVTVPEATINTTACSVALVGRRAVSYGEVTAENFVKLTENFAHTSAPSAPLVGQLWFDKTNSTLKIYSNSQWNSVVNVSAGGSSVSASTFNSTVATGTAPFTVASTTKVVNINADYLDGYSADENASANTIVVRDANGDIHVDDVWGITFHGTATSAQYADVAERFAASEPLEAGDVVEIGGEKEIEKARGLSALGVISASPALRMNDGAGSDETHPFVAFCGRVPCKVTGAVKKGDRLVSNGDGTAVAMATDVTFDTVLGRALEDKTDEGVGLVMIVVGVK